MVKPKAKEQAKAETKAQQYFGLSDRELGRLLSVRVAAAQAQQESMSYEQYL